MRLLLLLLGLCGLLGFEPAAFGVTAQALEPIAQTRLLMGSRLEIVLPTSSGQEQQAHRALEAAFREVERVDKLLSHYRPDSPLSRLAQTAGVFVKVDSEFFGLLKRCVRMSRRTQGAFDVTVAPLLVAYRRHGPGPEVTQALRLIGSDALELRPVHRVRLKQAGMALDPGGFGKGYAVDRVIAVLRASGIRRAFVNFGGSSLYGLGDAPDGAGWMVQLPQATPASTPSFVLLRNQSLSSSASRPPLEEGGLAAPHIVDPRAGTRIEALRVTAVISANAMDADILSTALLVLGREGLPLLARRFPGVEALFLDAHGSLESSGLSALRVDVRDPD